MSAPAPLLVTVAAPLRARKMARTFAFTLAAWALTAAFLPYIGGFDGSLAEVAVGLIFPLAFLVEFLLLVVRIVRWGKSPDRTAGLKLLGLMVLLLVFTGTYVGGIGLIFDTGCMGWEF